MMMNATPHAICPDDDSTTLRDILACDRCANAAIFATNSDFDTDMIDDPTNPTATDHYSFRRELLLMHPPMPTDNPFYNLSRDELSMTMLEYSLCPLHFIDFAICFDDDDPDCAQIRTIFPASHDT